MKCNPLTREALEAIANTRRTLENPTSATDRQILNDMKKDNKIPTYSEKSGEGIDINSKIRTALKKISASMPNMSKARLTPENLTRLLIKEGVSKKEIDFMIGDYINAGKNYDKAKSFKEMFDETHPDDRMGSLDDFLGFMGLDSKVLDGARPGKEPIRKAMTLARNNQIHFEVMNKTPYRRITKQFENMEDYKETGIYSNAVGDKNRQSHYKDEKNFLGWMRESDDTLKGKKVHILHEFQSDWAQNPDMKSSFPIDYSDFKKISIVKALDNTMKKGMDTLIIPVDRSGSLHGSEAISDMYGELQNGILPKIRKQLSDAGLKLDSKMVTRKGGSFDKAKQPIKDELKIVQKDLAKYNITRDEFVEMVEDLRKSTSILDMDKSMRYYSEDLHKHMKPSVQKAYDMYKTGSTDDYIELTLHPKKTEGKIRWDMLGVLGAIGLAGKATEEEK